MNSNILVAEPCRSDWTSIAKGVRRHLPDASILRVKDGEQALRFTFQTGLLTREPQIPDLLFLSADLAKVPAEHVLAQVRQDPRTQATAVLILWKDRGAARTEAFMAREWLFEITDTIALDRQVAEAVRRLCRRKLPRRQPCR